MLLFIAAVWSLVDPSGNESGVQRLTPSINPDHNVWSDTLKEFLNLVKHAVVYKRPVTFLQQSTVNYA